MSFNFVALSIDGTPIVVDSDDLPTPSSTGSGAVNFLPPFSLPTNPFQFSTSSQYYPFITVMQDDMSRRGGYFDGLQAQRPKKRKANVFEEEEATCAKCHYRRKCMKCTNCMARFCEQRCLTRYLEDQTEQEEARLTGNWLCPCCRGIEPVGKYKGSDILRSDEKDEAGEEGEQERPTVPVSMPSTPQPRVVPAITPVAREEPVQTTMEQEVPSTGEKAPREDDEACAVCGDVYSYDHNDIIFCEGCNVAVHQVCYGVYKVPTGDWHCDRCRARTVPQCNLCGLKGGALKQLLDKPHNWVHVTCVATLFECAPLELEAKIGPVGLLERVDKRRYKLKCEVCKEKNRKDITGPLIQCVARKFYAK